MLPNTESIRKIRIECSYPVKIFPPSRDVFINGRRCSRCQEEGAEDKATGIKYGAGATNWESMDSEAVSRPDRKEKSIGSGSGRGSDGYGCL